MYTIWTHRLVVKSANKDNNAAFCKILQSCFLVGSKANIQLLIFLATTLHTSVHNLSYSAAATTTPKWFWELNLQNTLQQSIYSSLIWVSFATVSPTFGAGHQSPQSSSQSSPGLDNLQGGLRHCRLFEPLLTAAIRLAFSFFLKPIKPILAMPGFWEPL